jgi:3'-5' exonuclease
MFIRMSHNSNIIVLDSITKIDSFIQYVQNLISKNHDQIYAALDFEFDQSHKTHNMSLAQLIFTYSDGKTSKTSDAYLMDFRLFSRKKFSRFERAVLTNPKVLKILHGAESLDLPALRKIISSDLEFKRFLSQMADTRFLCEAHHILLAKKGTSLRKCSIYDALRDTDVISKEEYQKLSSIKINYRKPWKIKKLSQKQITYAVADVLFLHNLYQEYRTLIGEELISLIMESYRYGVMGRMSLLTVPHASRKTTDLVDALKKANILQKTVAKSPIGPFTIGDLIKIDYLKKSAIRLAYVTYVDKNQKN